MRDVLIDYGDAAPTRQRVHGAIEIEVYPPGAQDDDIRMAVLRMDGRTVLVPPHVRLEFSGGR